MWVWLYTVPTPPPSLSFTDRFATSTPVFSGTFRERTHQVVEESLASSLRYIRM